MSLDAVYIFDYEDISDAMKYDIEYLKERHRGDFVILSEWTFYWEKLKYLLPEEDIQNLLADRILEKQDCDLFRVIK